MTTFASMGLPEALNHTLDHMEFKTPTPIQEQAIPAALEGKDILGSAQTGTGKTGAFGIPVVTHLMNNPDATALIMTPTRELASQVMKQMQEMLGKRSKIKTALLIGGEPMMKQFRQLDREPRLIVGTPGRIHDHLNREKLNLESTEILVLDETDRMLDMGFSIQIEAILDYMPQKRQTLLFSATLPKNIMRLTQQYLDNPVRIAVDQVSTASQNIKQDVMKINDADKYPQLLTELDERAGSIIVFMKTKHATEKMAIKLTKDGVDAKAVHGDLRQNKRERVVAAFRKQKYRVLVATDVAARGLDIPHIEHVINYDLPQCPEDYIHRIGRTGRAGATGEALCFVSPRDKGKWIRIDRLMNPDKKFDKKSERFFDEDDRPRKNFKARKRIDAKSNPFGDRRNGDKRSNDRRRSDDKFGNRSEKRFDKKTSNRKPNQGENRREDFYIDDVYGYSEKPNRKSNGSKFGDRPKSREGREGRDGRNHQDWRQNDKSGNNRKPKRFGKSDQDFDSRPSRSGSKPFAKSSRENAKSFKPKKQSSWKENTADFDAPMKRRSSDSSPSKKGMSQDKLSSSKSSKYGGKPAGKFTSKLQSKSKGRAGKEAFQGKPRPRSKPRAGANTKAFR